MVSIPLKIPADYWQTFQVNKKDIEFLLNHLFECETPLTARELVEILIEERIRSERVAQAKKQQAAGKIYLPKERYKEGEDVETLVAEAKAAEEARNVNPKTSAAAVAKASKQEES